MPLERRWIQWVAENLLLDIPPDTLVATLVAEGLPEHDARGLVEDAQTHPYVEAGRSAARRARKRDWLLRTLRGLADDSPHRGLDRRHALALDEFHERYYAANRPVLLLDAALDWPAVRRWTPRELGRRLGHDVEVEVQSGRDANQRYERESHRLKTRMRLGDFVARVESAEPTNDVYLTANNGNANAALFAPLADDLAPLPAMLDAQSPDRGGLLWLGPPGTITPAHHDLTNNVLVQIAGRKVVHLASSLALPDLHNDHHVYTPVDLEHPDLQRFPSLRDVVIHEVTLLPGQALFIPIGWWHQVRALDPSISVTFTNFVFRNDWSQSYASNGPL